MTEPEKTELQAIRSLLETLVAEVAGVHRGLEDVTLICRAAKDAADQARAEALASRRDAHEAVELARVALRERPTEPDLTNGAPQ